MLHPKDQILSYHLPTLLREIAHVRVIERYLSSVKLLIILLKRLMIIKRVGLLMMHARGLIVLNRSIMKDRM